MIIEIATASKKEDYIARKPEGIDNYMREEEYKFLLLFILAIINDAVDLLGLFNPFIEVLLDLLIASMINILLGFNIWAILITFIDIIPGIDLAPIWTLYMLKLYLSRSKTKYRRLSLIHI